MKVLADFKAFAMKGNVVDMAVGVVIGAGFGKIVTSLVADIITPVLGLLIGGLDFKDMKLTLRDAVANVPAVTWNYGAFLQTVFDFMIIAAAIFSLVRLMAVLQRKKPVEPPPPPAPPAEVVLLTEIRDALLKSRA